MKKIILSLFIIGALTTGLKAQQITNKAYVSTTGQAEREVTPDIIYMNVTLKEYAPNNNYKNKITIEKLENQLFASVTKAGIKKEDLTIQNIWSSSYATKKNKNPEILLSRQYRIKVTDLTKLDEIFDGVDKAGLQSTSIGGYDYSKKKELQKELKTEAVKNALENAKILAAAAGQTIGKALLLSETPQQIIFNAQPVFRTMAMKADVAESAPADMDLNIKPMTVTSEIQASFELL